MTTTETQDVDDSPSIETGEDWSGTPTILNPQAFVEEIEANVDAWLTPEGERMPFEVENPNLNGDPKFLRVTGHRKSLFFKVANVAHEWGLVIDDAWALDHDAEDDLMKVKLVPVEATEVGQ